MILLWQKRCAALMLFGLVMFVSACATPIGVKRITPLAAYQEEQENPLNETGLSNETKYILGRFDLQETFTNDPEQAIARLHEKALNDDRRDLLYVLAEISYAYADQLRRSRKRGSDYFFLSAVYAYIYLLADMEEPPPTAFDQRFRTACDLYNFSLWGALTEGKDGKIEFSDGRRDLPLGSLVITLDLSKLPREFAAFDQFVPSPGYTLRGVTVRNRSAGLGLPLIALKNETAAVPVTAFLRLQGGLAELIDGTASANLELYSAYDDVEVVVHNTTVPLETDTTTPIAYSLEKDWEYGIEAFLGDLDPVITNQLYLIQPYQPGRIPVVFVHGTASAPTRWMEMWNTLHADSELRRRYQFWFFSYNSGMPTSISAADLRDSLNAQLALIDPEGRDPALHDMVIIGHSQGGLLAKFCVVDTDERLLRALFDEDLDTLDMPADTKDSLRHVLDVDPLPFVKRVVFISTPHRGSYMSKSWMRGIMSKLITLPKDIVELPVNMYKYVQDEQQKNIFSKRGFTSIDSMSPANPVLKALVDTPLAPGVIGNSIIAVKNPDDPKEKWKDGVITYSSAQLDGMESEFIVNASHSCQGNPLVIEEVRRILLEHLQGSL